MAAKYRLIADDLEKKIKAGKFRPPANRGPARMPTEAELMEEYEASRNTIRDAIKVLAARNLVATRAGEGTFVVTPPPPILTKLGGDPTAGKTGEPRTGVRIVGEPPRTVQASDPRVEIQKADEVIASELEIPLGSPVISRHQRRHYGDEPWSLQTSFYPMEFVHPGGATRLLQAENIDEGAVAYLRELGINQVGYRDSIAVRAPDPTETSFFGLPADGRIPVFEVFTRAFDDRGRRMRLTISIYRAEGDRLIVDHGQVPAEQDTKPAKAKRPVQPIRPARRASAAAAH